MSRQVEIHIGSIIGKRKSTGPYVVTGIRPKPGGNHAFFNAPLRKVEGKRYIQMAEGTDWAQDIRTVKGRLTLEQTKKFQLLGSTIWRCRDEDSTSKTIDDEMKAKPVTITLE